MKYQSYIPWCCPATKMFEGIDLNGNFLHLISHAQLIDIQKEMDRVIRLSLLPEIFIHQTWAVYINSLLQLLVERLDGGFFNSNPIHYITINHLPTQIETTLKNGLGNVDQ